jgi:hypothetical protein
MTRALLFGLGSVCLAGATLLATQKQPDRPRTEFVELDATVVDDNGRMVPEIRQDEFRVKEDGRAVVLSTLAEISAAGFDGERDSRSIVLLLDDTSLSPTATELVQRIARLFADRMRPADHFSVMRLRPREDEPIGDQREALSRIADYRSGSYPFLDDTYETWLRTLAKISRGLPPSHRHTIVVAIGSWGLFDVYLPVPRDSLLWPYWRDALSTSADAGVSVDVVDPHGPGGRLDLGDGLVEETGGEVFARSNDFTRAIDTIWREASHYYRLGYYPTARRRDLHTIEVSVTRPGLHVRARRSRGD